MTTSSRSPLPLEGQRGAGGLVAWRVGCMHWEPTGLRSVETPEQYEETIMIRLLLTVLFAYTAYRVAMRIIDEVPGDVSPLDMPGDERRALRRQSAAMGVEPKR